MIQNGIGSTLQNQAVKGSSGFLDPERILLEFDLRSGMKVAEFGCGSGYFSILMAKVVGESGIVYAIDVLTDALDSVTLKAKAAGLTNLETVWCDLEVSGSTGLMDESLDAVLIANVLFQSNKKGNILDEAKRVLKNGGKLIVIDWKKGFSGFGPPDNLRMDDKAVRSLVKDMGFAEERTFDAGQFHFGLIFGKKVYF